MIINEDVFFEIPTTRSTTKNVFESEIQKKNQIKIHRLKVYYENPLLGI